MKNKKLVAISLFSILSFMISNQKVLAFEPLSAKELASHCVAYPKTPQSLDAQFCIRYIQGFIDGAIVTDKRVMLNIEAELEREETFSERAMRQRKARKTPQQRAAEYAEFCLGDTLKLPEVVSKVVTNLAKRKEIDETILARTVVYGVLKKQYPCNSKP